MNKRTGTVLAIGAMLAGVIACDNQPTDSGPGDVPGVHFDAGSGNHAASGTPTTDQDGSVLHQEFAVARADSVGGFALISFDPTGDGVGNLFVLQAPRSTGTFACIPSAQPCHGRYIVGVRNGSTITAERYFQVVEGTFTVTQVGPQRLRGSFNLTLRADDDLPNGMIVIDDGTVDVPYVSNEVTDGSLQCLLSLIGVGQGTCRA